MSSASPNSANEPHVRPQLHAVASNDPGATVPSLKGRRVGEIVVTLGFATVEAVAQAVATAQQTGKPTGRVLLDMGAISKEQLAQVLAARTQMSFLDLASTRLDERALQTIEPETAMRLRAVPVKYVDDDTLLVAVSDPANVLAADDIALMTGLNVRAALTTVDQLDELLSELSRNDMMQVTRNAERAAEGNDQLAADDEASSASALEKIMDHAVRQRASDVHFDVTSSGAVRVRFRIDGIVHDMNSVTPALAPKVMSRLKITAGLDIAVRQIPQDGRAVLGEGTNEIALRVATLPTMYGESAVVRILDKKSVPPLERLGMTARELAVLRHALGKPHGAVLATGPTGSGKTTTLYAALGELNRPERAIITIEDPVEYALDGVKQLQINPKRGLTFASGLRAMLRSDPDIIMVGEIRDRETAQIGIEAALTGRMVLSTLHTNSAAAAITRLAEMGVERYLIASSIECIAASRLARVLCEECKQPVHLNERMLREAGVDEQDRGPIDGFEAKGCPSCAGTGYRGRIGLFEVMAIDDQVRSLIIERYPTHEIESVAAARGMTSLRSSAISKVRNGLVSLSEATRITSIE